MAILSMVTSSLFGAAAAAAAAEGVWEFAWIEPELFDVPLDWDPDELPLT